jgi:hypothetical protein
MRMMSTISRKLGVVAAIGLAGVTLAGCGSQAPAGRVADKAAVAPAAVTVPARAKVLEFMTAGGRGYFYTTNPAEAAKAVAKYHFEPTGNSPGYLSTHSFKGALALYRLRYMVSSSYIVSFAAEKDRLVRSGKFVNEGILGYVATKPGTSEIQRWRAARNSFWRIVTLSDAKALKKTGWHLDGTLGYFWTKA